jgi:hypothetical protein
VLTTNYYQSKPKHLNSPVCHTKPMSGTDYQKKKPVSSHSIQNKSENKMSKQTESTKDVFAVYAKNFDKIHGNVEKATPQFLQAFTSLQQEFLTTWSNFVHSALAIQQHYATKMGINANVPETTTAVVGDVADEIVKAFDVQTKIVQTALDATRQNIKTINDNATAFAELNQNIINSWVTAWKTRN